MSDLSQFRHVFIYNTGESKLNQPLFFEITSA